MVKLRRHPLIFRFSPVFAPTGLTLSCEKEPSPRHLFEMQPLSLSIYVLFNIEL